MNRTRRYTIIAFTTALLLAPLAALHAVDLTENRADTNKISLVQAPLPASAIGAPEGFVGARWRANINGSLRGFDIDCYVGMVEQRKMRDWWWIGEQPGKWIESSVLSSAIARDQALGEKTKEILTRIVKAQATDGYLGISDPSVLNDTRPLRGMDPYEQYFTLHGLLTDWEVLGDKAALDAAAKLGGYYVNHIGPGKANFPHDRTLDRTRSPASSPGTLGSNAWSGGLCHRQPVVGCEGGCFTAPGGQVPGPCRRTAQPYQASTGSHWPARTSLPR